MQDWESFKGEFRQLLKERYGAQRVFWERSTRWAQVDPYRGFRNVYGFHLSPARALELLRPLPTAAQALHGDLDRFASRMRTLPEFAP